MPDPLNHKMRVMKESLKNWTYLLHIPTSITSAEVVTEAGVVPAVVSPGTVGDAVVPQEPHLRSFAPQTDTAHPRLEVR